MSRRLLIMRVAYTDRRPWHTNQVRIVVMGPLGAMRVQPLVRNTVHQAQLDNLIRETTYCATLGRR